ncbi:MAG: hypothetical protein KBT04_07315 [Bacteroidales bacterium]|nr:hypothetical protein [Candidatus Colimorpha onthohippi]
MLPTLNILLNTPWYYLLLCLACGAAYSVVLYWIRPPSGISKRLQWVLSVLRFVVVALIALLLLSPMIRRESHDEQKPIILIAEDNSTSIALCKDSTFYRGAYADSINRIVTELSDHYDVQRFHYGTTVSPASNNPDYQDPQTDISGAIRELAERFQNRNVGAMILSSDGIATAGCDPSSVNVPFPIYTIALGDTTPSKDAAISHLRYNRTACVGNKFPMEITIQAHGLNHQTATLRIVTGGKSVFEQPVAYNGNDFSTTIPVSLSAEHSGIQSYTIMLQTLDGERTSVNNKRTVSVEVADHHQQVVILAAAPHPDIAALQRAVAQNSNYDVKVLVGNEVATHEFNKENIYILHNLPSASVTPASKLLSSLHILYVVGLQTDLGLFNALQTGVTINTNLSKATDAVAIANPDFSSFSLADASRFQKLPPLDAPFGDYRCAAHVMTLFYAQIGNITTRQPLVALANELGHSNGIRTAFIFGEGVWKWRLHCYLQDGNHTDFDQFIYKTLSYIGDWNNQQQLHIDLQSVYPTNQPIVIGAELYDDLGQPTNQPELSFSLRHGSTVSNHDMSRSGIGYQLTLGCLDTGCYTYTATTTLSGKKITANGRFVVEDASYEYISLTANHALLNTLSQITDGQVVYPNQLSWLTQLIQQREDIKPVIYSHSTYTDLIDSPLLFLLILLLITTEWCLRKYFC